MIACAKASTSSTNCWEFTPAGEAGARERVSAVYSSLPGTCSIS